MASSSLFFGPVKFEVWPGSQTVETLAVIEHELKGVPGVAEVVKKHDTRIGETLYEVVIHPSHPAATVRNNAVDAVQSVTSLTARP